MPFESEESNYGMIKKSLLDPSGINKENIHFLEAWEESAEISADKYAEIIRDFFDTQALYPELWDDLQDTILYSDTNVGVLERPTIDNSRFFHMNEYPTRVDASPRNETFGDDAFTLRSPPNNIEMTSSPVFIYYDDSTRDRFVEPKDFTNTFVTGYSYGSFYPSEITYYDDQGVPNVCALPITGAL